VFCVGHDTLAAYKRYAVHTLQFGCLIQLSDTSFNSRHVDSIPLSLAEVVSCHLRAWNEVTQISVLTD
jgi:hypothetical protein